MDPETIGKVAEATKAVAETSSQAIEAATGLGRVIKGPIDDLIGMVSDRIKFIRWERRLTLAEKAGTIMKQRGLSNPTRELPLPFAVPLLTHAFLEESDELQEVWARLLVNAGDSATEMELRTAYIEILAGMSAFDVKNLSVMAELLLNNPLRINGSPMLMTWNLPRHAQFRSSDEVEYTQLSQILQISLGNLARLGCVLPDEGMFRLVRVTELGLALYRACS